MSSLSYVSWETSASTPVAEHERALHTHSFKSNLLFRSQGCMGCQRVRSPFDADATPYRASTPVLPRTYVTTLMLSSGGYRAGGGRRCTRHVQPRARHLFPATSTSGSATWSSQCLTWYSHCSRPSPGSSSPRRLLQSLRQHQDVAHQGLGMKPAGR